MMSQAELVGGVLYHAADPFHASAILAKLLLARDEYTPAHVEELGFEPALVDSLRHALPLDATAIQMACVAGAAWVMGRRSVVTPESWDLVASWSHDLALPSGLRHTTAETLVALVSGAERYLRLVAPYIDGAGILVVLDAIAASTRRGVDIEVFEPIDWPPGVAAMAGLRAYIGRYGDVRHLSVVTPRRDAAWPHLKVVIADGTAAYIGSANFTGAGLAGRNLELGVLVRGAHVAVINKILDLYSEL